MYTQADLRIHDTASGGECLFDSVRLVLESEGIHTNIQELRRLVASTVLDLQDAQATEAIVNWKMYYLSDLRQEFMHVHNVVRTDEPPNIVTVNDRRMIFSNMLSPNLYWGDEYALRIMEREFKVTFLVFRDTRHKPVYAVNHEPGWQFSHYILLFLAGCHYNPVSLNGKFLIDNSAVLERYDLLPK